MEDKHTNEETQCDDAAQEAQMPKRVYERPLLAPVGSFVEMTRGSSGCCAVDFYLYYTD